MLLMERLHIKTGGTNTHDLAKMSWSNSKFPVLLTWSSCSIGTAESLGRGSVQYMSAGTGVTHSEMNRGDDMYGNFQFYGI